MNARVVEQLSLPLPKEVFAVHCFFAPRCKHIVRSDDPYKAGALMEDHYTKKHQEQINRICGKAPRR